MTRIGLAQQLQAATLAHYEARAQLDQQIRAGRLSAPERVLKLEHVKALRAVRETLVTLLRDQAPGLSRLQHDAMCAAAIVFELPEPDQQLNDELQCQTA